MVKMRLGGGGWGTTDKAGCEAAACRSAGRCFVAWLDGPNHVFVLKKITQKGTTVKLGRDHL